jgi:hypothetical protein
MSQQYPGGIITKNAVVPSGPYQNSTASGVWTLDQAAQYTKAGNWPTAGNLPNYIEDVFSTYLYTGNGSTQTITNGIDLSTKGGLVWCKIRSGFNSPLSHALFDTNRGALNRLASNLTAAQATTSGSVTAFNSNGFSVGSSVTVNGGGAGDAYASWTFRKQPKFFDVVTYTGNGANDRVISHNLGSVPGFIIIKSTSAASNWVVYHRSIPSDVMFLERTDAAINGGVFYVTATSSTTFTVGRPGGGNGNGQTYVAYLFAHDAGGFGLSGTDNVISCGSYTSSTGSTSIPVTLGFEPQWILVKSTGNSSANWNMFDVMRGWPVGANGQSFRANTSDAEAAELWFEPTATGFIVRPGPNLEYNEAGGYRYIYIAIRRGPMKVPTSGTSVFNTIVRAGTAANATVSGVGFSPDLAVVKGKTSGDQVAWNDRLRGTLLELMSSNLNAEISTTDTIFNFTMDGASLGADATRFDYNATGHTYANWFFKRAPGFMDVVCYTGTGVARTVAHNLAAVPEMMIVKRRNLASAWLVYTAALGPTKSLFLEQNTGPNTSTLFWNDTTPTSAVFTVGTIASVNNSGDTYVAYLFATLAGISKVGSYTGTGTTQVINCGFTAGSRFVMIKRTDSTGDWYVWDSARGIVAGNDPYLLLNSTAAEVTSTDYIDTAASGFEISSTAPAAINASGGSFIFLAIA